MGPYTRGDHVRFKTSEGKNSTGELTFVANVTCGVRDHKNPCGSASIEISLRNVVELLHRPMSRKVRKKIQDK